MSWLRRRRATAEDETPEQTLERLSRAGEGSGPPSVRPPRTTRFTVVRLKEGYAMDQVDAFVDSIDRRTADEIDQVRFATVRLREGYDVTEVDDFLDLCAERSAAAATGRAPDRPGVSVPKKAGNESWGT